MAVFENLNWLAILLAIASYFILGGIWFPLIVKNAYRRALNHEMSSGIVSLIVPLACITVTTITCAVLIRLIGVKSYTDAIGFGLLVGIGYLTPMVVNIAMNPLFPRPTLYSVINAPYFIGGSVLVSLILVGMG